MTCSSPLTVMLSVHLIRIQIWHILTKISQRLNKVFASSNNEWSSKFIYKNNGDYKKLIEISRINRGVKDVFVMGEDDLNSDEINILDNAKEFLNNYFSRKCVFTTNEENYEIKDPLDLATKITNLGKKGSQVHRYKG